MGSIELIIIAGPTAAGKTSASIELAREFNGEVVSADSMQVYKFMDIGTAKPSIEERAGIAHHLIDIVNPDEEYSAARYSEDAKKAIDGILERGKLPFLVGGTGLYIRALTKGIFKGPSADPAVRQTLLDEARGKGREALYERLRLVDPEAAKRIHPNNVARVVRALEVFEISKRPMTEFHKEHGFSERPYKKTLFIGIKKERQELYRGIEERVEAMFAKGLVEEARRLIEMGFSPSLKPMRGLGYKEACAVLDGSLGIEAAKEQLKKETRHYAKRQLTWFNAEPEIKWFYPGQKPDIMEHVKRGLN